MPSQRLRRCMFTCNNPTAAELAYFRGLVSPTSRCSYVLFGLEIAPLTGTPHAQGYAEFSRTPRLALRALFPRSHITAPLVGTAAQAITYCKKDGAWEEFGVAKEQGKRSDLLLIQADIKAGALPLEIAENYFTQYVFHRKSFDVYRRLLRPERDTMSAPEVYFIHGPTGTGKTRICHEEWPALWRYPGKGWFDGYQGEPTVLFDDLTEDEFPITKLLHLLDRWPMQVAIKGGYTDWLPTVILITSQDHINQWYAAENPARHAALMRRITHIHQFV